MTETTIRYIEVESPDADGKTTIHSKEETWHNDHVPRIGEEVFIDGDTRTVVNVCSYSDQITVSTYRQSDYEYLTEQERVKMRSVGLNPE